MGKKKKIEDTSPIIDEALNEEVEENNDENLTEIVNDDVSDVEDDVPIESVVNIGRVKVAKLNLRAKPTIESKVKKILDEGTTVEFKDVEDNAEFVQVVTEGIEGYVMKKFIEV